MCSAPSTFMCSLTASIPAAQIFIREVGCDFVIVLFGAVFNAQAYTLTIEPAPSAGVAGTVSFDPNDEREHRYNNLASGTEYRLSLIASGNTVQQTNLDVRTSMAIMLICHAIF